LNLVFTFISSIYFMLFILIHNPFIVYFPASFICHLHTYKIRLFQEGVIEESWTALMIYVTATIFNTLATFFIRTSYLQEDFLEYCLICMKVKIGWIPFLDKIQQKELIDKIINYRLIKCPIPFVTPLNGNYQQLSFLFSELNVLSC